MKISKKLLREVENERSLGGVRNPWKAVRRLSKVAEVGRDIARLWRRFALRHPQALNLARAYGSPECKPDDEITMAWRRDLKTLLKANSNSAPQLREKFEFKSPLEPELWEAWARMSGDPEQSIGDWARRGAPLGMAVEIPKSNGVFPPCLKTMPRQMHRCWIGAPRSRTTRQCTRTWRVHRKSSGDIWTKASAESCLAQWLKSDLKQERCQS